MCLSPTIDKISATSCVPALWGRSALTGIPRTPPSSTGAPAQPVWPPPDDRTVELSVNGVQAHVIDRVGYVASMADKAKAAGATYCLGSRATEVTVREDRCQVRFTSDAGEWTGEARAVVLASGFGSELGHKAGLGRPGDYVGAAQAEVEAPGIDQISIYVGRSVAPGFFAWLVPTSSGRALVGLLARHRAMDHLDSLIAHLERVGKIAGIVRWSLQVGYSPQASTQDLRPSHSGRGGRGGTGQAHHRRRHLLRAPGQRCGVGLPGRRH